VTHVVCGQEEDKLWVHQQMVAAEKAEKSCLVEKTLEIYRIYTETKCDMPFTGEKCAAARCRYEARSIQELRETTVDLIEKYIIKEPDHPNVIRRLAVAHLKKARPIIVKWGEHYLVRETRSMRRVRGRGEEQEEGVETGGIQKDRQRQRAVRFSC
jgi:hypothetical protein